MKKIISLVASILLLSSCEQANKGESEANKLFVEAAIKADLAMKEYENSNVKGALVFLEEALANTDRILLDYPATTIAVNLVSNKDISLGLNSYVELRGHTLKDIKNYATYIDKYGDLGELLYKSDKDKVKEAFAYFYDWREAKYRVTSHITKEDIKHFAGREFVQKPILSASKLEISQQRELEESVVIAEDIAMEDVVKMTKQIKMNVDLVAYEKDAILYLYKLSEGIEAKPNLMQLLEPNMSKIKDNIVRITLPDVREKAYCVLSKIYTNMNNSMAMNVAIFNIKNEELSAEALTYYVDKLIDTGRLKSAMELLDFIKIQLLKDDIAVGIAIHLAKTDPMQALEVLVQCANEEKRKDAIVQICVDNMTEENLDFYAKVLLNSTDTLDAEDLKAFAQRLSAFWEVAQDKKSEAYYNALILGELAKLFSKYDEDFSQNLGVKIIDTISQTDDAKEQVEILNIVFDTVLYLGNTRNIILNFSDFKKYLSEEDWQNVYLKFAVAHYLKGDEKGAKNHLDMLNMDIVDTDYLKIALLKANRTKAEINKILKN